MSLIEAIENAKSKRNIYDMDVYVLRDECGKYFTTLEINLDVFMKSNYQIDKQIYYTAWNTKK